MVPDNADSERFSRTVDRFELERRKLTREEAALCSLPSDRCDLDRVQHSCVQGQPTVAFVDIDNFAVALQMTHLSRPKFTRSLFTLAALQAFVPTTFVVAVSKWVGHKERNGRLTGRPNSIEL